MSIKTKYQEAEGDTGTKIKHKKPRDIIERKVTRQTV